MFGLVTLVNGVKKLVDISTSPRGASLPNGYIYIQMPGTEPPTTLFGGTWQLVDYAGNSCGSAFNSGRQGYGLSSTGMNIAINSNATSHCHQLYYRTCDYCPYVYAPSTTYLSCYGSSLLYQSTPAHSHSISMTTWDAETRPDNYTIQIWKKTSD